MSLTGLAVAVLSATAINAALIWFAQRSTRPEDR